MSEGMFGNGLGLAAAREEQLTHFSQHRRKLLRSAFSGPVAGLLRERIIIGALPPGTMLAETRLAEEFSVSRGPIRNALQALEAEGLVLTQPNGRVAVVGFSEDDIDDLLDTRFVLEFAAAERALGRSADLGPLEDALVAMAAEGASTPGLVDLDIAFHLALIDASGSRFLRHAWLASASVIRASISISLRQLTERGAASSFILMLDNHRAILDGLQAGDLDQVGETIQDHFRGLSGTVFPHADPS